MLVLNGIGASRTAAAATPPVPMTLPVFFWFDPSDEATIVQTAGSVSQWNDKSPNGYHLTQATGASQPSYGARYINGLKAVDFDGTNDTMLFPSGAYSIATGSNTFLMVLSPDTLAKATQPLIGNVGGADNGYTIGIDEYSGTVIDFKQGGSVSPSQTTPSGTAFILGFRRNGSLLEAIYNGTVLGSTSSASNQTLTSLALSRNGASRQIDGLVGEIVACNQSLSNTNINLLGNYLAGKWGATWTGI